MPRQSTPESTLRSLSSTAIESALRKDQAIIFRVSKDDKEEIQRTARGFQLTMTEYLLRIHQLVHRRTK